MISPTIFRINLRTGSKLISGAFLIIFFFCAFSFGLAQDIATKGAISGRVTDAAGAVIPGAKVVVSGETGTRAAAANEHGEFEVQNLIPGNYTVKAEHTGFKTVSVPNVQVYVGKTSSLKLTLEAGNITEIVEISAGAAGIDSASTAVGSNLNDQIYQNLPVQRNVQSLFYLAPGATDSLGGGRANPSISGASPLDNLYIADGVNITDSGFGGLGVFSRSYGTLGVGINTQYIKEVQVKTGGFEPQYGQSQGGIVNIITKSGTSDYHGSVYGYFQPKAFEALRRQPDDVRINKFGEWLHNDNYDAGFDVSGPVPGLKDRLLFFGSFNPTIQRQIVRGAEGSGLLALYGDQTQRRFFSKNYAFKADFNLTPSHLFNFSIFGDPTTTNTTAHSTLNVDNDTALSQLDYGTRNIAVRYNGSITPTWTVSASFSQGHNKFDELDFANFNQIIDRTQPERGNFRAIGLGLYEPTNGTTYRATIDTQKQASFFGTHTLGVGYNFQRAYFSGIRERSGPRFTIPATNVDGIPVTSPTVGSPAAAAAIGQSVNATWDMFTADADSPRAGCTLCPLLNIGGVDVPVVLRQDRGEYNNPSFNTESKYHAAYVQDTWRINRFVTALLGYRWEQERLVGSPGTDGNRINYVFSGNWSPRFGATVDPFGKGKTKFYYNFGRFHEYIPLDLALRSLSAEADFRRGWYIPDYFIDAQGNRRARLNQYGTVIPIIDAQHLVTGASGGIDPDLNGAISISLQDPSNPILNGTKLGYTNEHLIGFEQQLPGNWFVSVRYINRKIGRIVEDAAVVSPESADFFGQTYFIGNIKSSTDAATNPIGFRFNPVFGPDDGIINLPSQCDPELVNPNVTDFAGNNLGGICYAANGVNGEPAGAPIPDGVADGFPEPERNYRAIEFELNKRFSAGWQLMANYRYAMLNGNFEGHYRNDNNQEDPAISSLFDFTAGEFGLLGDQFAVGPLNTERRHIANIYGSYALGERGFAKYVKGLNLGAGIRLESGVPLSEYLAHPVYLSPGEIPIGGRGSLGRTPFFAQFDLHADYPFRITERMSMTVVGDFFNVTNNRRVRLEDQFRESTAGQINPDFRSPAAQATSLNIGYHQPFSMRLGLKFEF
jgi:Carboxypeptidase regulatory-like domain